MLSSVMSLSKFIDGMGLLPKLNYLRRPTSFDSKLIKIINRHRRESNQLVERDTTIESGGLFSCRQDLDLDLDLTMEFCRVVDIHAGRANEARDDSCQPKYKR